MRTVIRGSLRTHTRRYVAAVLAVTIAVGFVVVTNAVASSARNGLSAAVAEAYAGADLVVTSDSGIDQPDVETVTATAERLGDDAAVIGTTWTAATHEGRSWGDRVPMASVAVDATLRRQEVTSGRAPSTPDEALVTTSRAQASGVEIGDRLSVGAPGETRDVTVVGIADNVRYLDGDVLLPWDTIRSIGGFAESATYAVRGGGGDAAVSARADALREATGLDVMPRAEFVEQRVVSANQGVDIIGYLLLLFAAVAGFVSVLVIANTFTILFAQRAGDFALLRCVGATRRQVVRSVRVEALMLALLSSTLGIVGGAAAGYGLVAVGRATLGDLAGEVELSPVWLGAAFVGGLVVTTVAAWWPTRAVVRVSPLEALRPVEADAEGSRAGLVRTGLGVLTVAAGGALLAAAVSLESLPVLLAGGMVSFVGVLLLGPVIVPAALRAIGAVVGRFGPAPRIAAGNAVRHPKRSAATAASLLVGVTLTTAIVTGLASAEAVLDDELGAEYPVDVAVTGTAGVSDGTVEAVDAVADVDRAVGVEGVVGRLHDGDEIAVLAPVPSQREVAGDHEILQAADGEVLVGPTVASGFLDGLPEQAQLTVGDRSVEVTVRSVPSRIGDAVVVSPATLASLGGTPQTLALWADARPGVDGDDLGGAVGAAIQDDGLTTVNAVQETAWVDGQFGVLRWSVIGLLGVAVVIALGGIANTVGLSVLERRREHALLRALGLTRRQLRRVLAAEGLLLALVAALLGTGIGVLYGWLGLATVIAPTLPSAGLVVPWGQLTTIVVVAAVAGLAACVIPARRAALVAPAQGLTLD